MTALSDLIARVEGLKGPDREVDAWVGYFTDLKEDDLSWRVKIDRFGIEHALQAATNYNNVWSTALPQYSASIDAVVALIDRELPGWARMPAPRRLNCPLIPLRNPSLRPHPNATIASGRGRRTVACATVACSSSISGIEMRRPTPVSSRRPE